MNAQEQPSSHLRLSPHQPEDQFLPEVSDLKPHRPTVSKQSVPVMGAARELP
jgi:hypothetical protein